MFQKHITSELEFFVYFKQMFVTDLKLVWHLINPEKAYVSFDVFCNLPKVKLHPVFNWIEFSFAYV